MFLKFSQIFLGSAVHCTVRLRSIGLKRDFTKQQRDKRKSEKSRRCWSNWPLGLSLLLLFLSAIPRFAAGEKEAVQYGAGLITNVPFSEAEVVQAVQDVVQNGIIRGTREYNKDEYVSGATAQSSSRAFPAWTEGGQVFYKQRLHAIDPRNFKDGGDVGTLTVRYIVQKQDEKNCVVRIDAIFVEDFRRSSHLSNGSVESAEYKDVHDHIEAIELMKEQTAEAQREKELRANSNAPLRQQWSSSASTSGNASPSSHETASMSERPSSTSVSSAAGSTSGDGVAASNLGDQGPSEPESLAKRVQFLRQQVERRVKSPGAPLKSAPFHTAGTLQLLSPGTEVLIVISSPYWYGIETHDGQHGWIPRDEVELLP